MGKPILFYGAHGLYSEFSNFYQAQIRLGGKWYPTVEHYFQASKAITKQEHEKVRTAGTAGQAKHLGRHVKLRPDWEKVKLSIMRKALLAKFSQHEDLKQLLLSTGTQVIHEVSPTDAVWGYMGGGGQDLLGKCLMKVRTIIRER